MAVTGVGSVRCEFRYRVGRAGGEVLRARTLMGFFDYSARRLVRRPADFLTRPRFRHEFYSEIQKVILCRLRDAEQTGQWPCAVFHEITGRVASIIQERWHDLRFRKETMMIIANEKPGWFFYLGWVALNASAVIMAWYNTFAIMDLVTGEDDSLIFILLFPIHRLFDGYPALHSASSLFTTHEMVDCRDISGLVDAFCLVFYLQQGDYPWQQYGQDRARNACSRHDGRLTAMVVIA